MRDSKLTVFVDDLPLSEDQTIIVIDSGFARRDPAERNSWDLTRIAKPQKPNELFVTATLDGRGEVDWSCLVSFRTHLGGVILM